MANGFDQAVTGLLESPTFNLGAGLLAASGPSLQPVGFGQALAGGMDFAGQRQQQINQNALQRQALQQRKRRQEAIGEIQGLMSPGQAVGNMPAPGPRIQTPEGRQQAMGLLGEVAPQQFAQGLLGQMFAQPEQPRTSTAFNDFQAMQQMPPEQRQQFVDFVAANDQDPLGTAVQQAQLQSLIMELENARTERQQQQEDERTERASLVRSVSTDLKKLEEMAELNQRLQGTILETGVPMPEARRALAGGTGAISSVFGIGDEQASDLSTAYDRFSKLTEDFVIGSLDRFAGSGAITNTKFEALLGANASVRAAPGANSLVIADNFDALLNAADIEGINISDRDRYEQLVESLRSGGPAAAAQDPATPRPEVSAPTGGSVIDFNDLPE